MIEGMKSLEYLYLNDNLLTGQVPVTELGNLSRVKSICLSNNEFKDIEETHAALISVFSSASRSRNVEVDMLGQGQSLHAQQVSLPNRGKHTYHNRPIV